MQTHYQDFLIRDWQPADREVAAEVIRSVLQEYGLGCEPEGADSDVWRVEEAYWQKQGEFWVVEQQGKIVGTAAYYPIERDKRTAEIRKMYLLPQARRQGLGSYLLQRLEQTIAHRGYEQILIETASILKEAVKLYELNGYQPIAEVETKRCDRAYIKPISC